MTDKSSLIRKNFFGHYSDNKKSFKNWAQEFEIINNGCLILNELFKHHLILFIQYICSFLSWAEFSRAAELVNFSLISCCDSKTCQKIFLKNSTFLKEVIKINQLDYDYLRQLDPRELFNNYQLIHRIPKFSRFAELDMSGLEFRYTLVRFHPTLPICAIFQFPYTFSVLAYDKDSQIRRKCWATGLLYHQNFFLSDPKIIDLQWSPRGNYLCVFFSKSSKTLEKHVISELHFDCLGNCESKKIVLLHLDTQMGELKSINLAEPFLICQWHQSNHVWSDDNVLTVYNHKFGQIQRFVLNVQEKVVRQHTLSLKPKLFLEKLGEKFVSCINHPNFPHTIILQSVCSKLNHHHHRLFFYNLASEKTDHTISIPGTVFDILADHSSDYLLVFYYEFKNLKYFSSKKEENTISCFLEMTEILAPHYKDHYKGQTCSYNVKNTGDIRIRSINLKTLKERELIDLSFDQEIKDWTCRTKPTWFEWILQPQAGYRQLTNQHVIISEPQSPTYKIGRFHNSLTTISNQYKASVRLNGDVWSFHPEENIFATTPSMNQKLLFFYCPDLLDDNTKSSYYKKYLAIRNSAINLAEKND